MPMVHGAWSKSTASVLMGRTFSKVMAKFVMEAAEREARAKSTMQLLARVWSKAKCRPKAPEQGPSQGQD